MSNYSAYTLLKCPECSAVGQMVVIDSRAVKSINGIRRRRRCDECGHRFTTYETLGRPEYDRSLDRARGVLQLALDQLKNTSGSD